MRRDDFLWLQKWYFNHCDGDWEHDKRIHIGTFDNPGWAISINLQDTELENRKFEKMNLDRSVNDWIFCAVRNHQFEGRCGPINLEEMLNIFRKWAEDETQTP